MCVAALAPIFTGLGAGGAATAAGATAAAATTGGFLQTVGTVLSVTGALSQGIGEARAANTQARLIETQKQTEAQLTAIKDQRERAAFAAEIAKQRGEFAARGVSLDSPTSILLGQEAAREMSFNSQALQSGGRARRAELTANQRMLRGRRKFSLLRGGFRAAGTLIDQAQVIWPGLQS